MKRPDSQHDGLGAKRREQRYSPSSKSLMSFAACSPSSFKFFSMALLLSIAARSSALMVQPMMMAVVAGQACRKADQPGLDPLLPRRRGSAPSHHTSKQQQDATTNTLRSSTNKQEGSWLEPPSSLVLPWLRCLS